MTLMTGRYKNNKDTQMSMLVVFVFSLILIAGVADAAICNSNAIPNTPTARFINNNDGTVKDIKTGLIWKRCPEGKIFSDNGTPDDLTDDTCSGSALEILWQEALQRVADVNTGGGYANATNWRLPNIKELASIIELQCYAPAFNVVIFPSMTGPNAYWSSSQDASNGARAWVMHTWYGADSRNDKSTYLAGVILLRDGD